MTQVWVISNMLIKKEKTLIFFLKKKERKRGLAKKEDLTLKKMGDCLCFICKYIVYQKKYVNILYSILFKIGSLK